MKKDLNYWKNNAEEDYLQVPISGLRYITELEKSNTELLKQNESLKTLLVDLHNNVPMSLTARFKIEELLNTLNK